MLVHTQDISKGRPSFGRREEANSGALSSKDGIPRARSQSVGFLGSASVVHSMVLSRVGEICNDWADPAFLAWGHVQDGMGGAQKATLNLLDLNIWYNPFLSRSLDELI